MKRSVKQSFSETVFNVLFFIVNQIIALLLAMPYLLWRTVFPLDSRLGHPISKFFRKLFEAKRTKQIIGINLAIFIVLASILQGSIFAQESETQKPELTKIMVQEEPVKTETVFRQPVAGYISQNFTWYHPGIDIAGNNNYLVHPIASGKIASIENTAFGYGLSILVKHENGIESRYAHLQNIDVAIGQEIDKDTILGHIGSTGWSTGPHLHFEVYQNGVVIDPLTVLPNGFETSYISLSTPTDDAVLIAADNSIDQELLEKMATFSAEIKSVELEN